MTVVVGPGVAAHCVILPNKLHRIVRSLTFEHWVGAPIPSRLKPDGVRTNVGSRVRFREATLGFLWSEWGDFEGDRFELVCRLLDGEDEVTRAMVDTAAAAFLLASEWAAKADVGDDLFTDGDPDPSET